jgi:hypothetical protein
MKKLFVSLITGVFIAVVLSLAFWQNFSWENVAINFIYGFVFAFLNHLYYEKTYRFLGWNKAYRTFILSILLNLPFNAGIFFILNMLQWSIQHKPGTDFLSSQSPWMYLIAMFISLLISLIFISFHFIQKIFRQELETEKLKTAMEQSKLVGLKAQLDPHFLFNSLNVLTALINENPHKAESFTLKLAGIYHYVLQHHDNKTIFVEKEIDFARDYLELLKIKYEDGLLFDIQTDGSEKHKKIPPLSLQILLENAIKHNAITQTFPLHLRINIKNAQLEVTNNLLPKANPATSNDNGGLNNLRKRYLLIMGEAPVIQQTESEFIVTLPLL